MTTLLLLFSLMNFNLELRAEELRCAEDVDELRLVRRADGRVTIALVQGREIRTFSLDGGAESLAALVARGVRVRGADGDLELIVEGGHTLRLSLNGHHNVWACD